MSAARKLRRALDPAGIMSNLQRTGRDRCLICGGPPYRFGVWMPNPECSRRLGAPPGKTRAVHYCLCRACDRRRPGVLTEVENTVLAQTEAALRLAQAN